MLSTVCYNPPVADESVMSSGSGEEVLKKNLMVIYIIPSQLKTAKRLKMANTKLPPHPKK